jgi:hypothetical protein
MAWKPKDREVEVPFDPAEIERYRSNDSAGQYFGVAWPRSLGKSHHGEFPVVVVREHFRALGYTVLASEPELPKDEGFLLVAYPGKRERRHPAYERMVGHFGDAVLARLNRHADKTKARYGKSRGGGDPDLFVFRGGDRFFVEVKWRDQITQKQSLTFPLIERYCQVPIKVARIRRK